MTNEPFEFVDAHHHLWDLKSGIRYGWLTDKPFHGHPA